MFLLFYVLIINHQMIYCSEVSLLRNSSDFNIALETKSFDELLCWNICRRGNFIHPTKFTIQNNARFWRSLNQQMRYFVIIKGFFIVFLLWQLLKVIKCHMNAFRLSYEQFVAVNFSFLLAARLQEVHLCPWQMTLQQVWHQVENWNKIMNGFVVLPVVDAVATKKLVCKLVVQNFIRHSEGVHYLRWQWKITNVYDVIFLIYNMAKVDRRKRNFLIHKASSVEYT